MDTIHIGKLHLSHNNDRTNIEQLKIAQTNDAKLRKVAQDFEALFLKQVFDVMRASNMSNEDSLLPKGMGEEIFEDMLYNEYTQNAAQFSHIGIADLIYKEYTTSALNSVAIQNSNNFVNIDHVNSAYKNN